VPKGSPHQITSFTSGHIFSFDWSSDGKQLYVARGSISSDIVQLTNRLGRAIGSQPSYDLTLSENADSIVNMRNVRKPESSSPMSFVFQN
jgi:hypothetical protein